MESFQPNFTQLNNHFEAPATLDPDPPTTSTTHAVQLPDDQPQSQQQIAQADAEVLQNGNSIKQQQQQLENPTVTSESDHPTTSNDTEKPQEEEDMDDDDNGDADDDDDLEEEEEDPPPKKQKQLSALTESLPPPLPTTSATSTEDDTKTPPLLPAPLPTATTVATVSVAKKKSKSKKNNSVWVTRSTRKGKKKTKLNNNNAQNTPAQDTVLITPVPRLQDKTDDSPDLTICLSKVYKAEKVELSEDRLSAGSTKGYRMVRATRGVCEGAWYFEIKVVSLGETGHTRLGWSNEKGDLQAPVGYDANSFGYRGIDGSKVHKALREKYGEEGYKEGDVIGFYINLPDGLKYTPKPPHLVWYKGQRYSCAPDSKEDPPKTIPGSEISFFKNGVFQGIAYKDLYGGRYYPAASMYTLPNQPNCTVKFNFGPGFECFPEDFGERPIPRPMFEVPYRGIENRVENGMSNENKN